MMKEKIIYIFIVLFFVMFSGVSIANAVMLDFNDDTDLGVAIWGGVEWTRENDERGQGHLYLANYSTFGHIRFQGTGVYLNSFQMNGLPRKDYDRFLDKIGSVDLQGFDYDSKLLFRRSIDLSDYKDWDCWLDVNINVENVHFLQFYTMGSYWWPSIDNIIINDNFPIPEPSTILLFGLGLLGLAGVRCK